MWLIGEGHTRQNIQAAMRQHIYNNKKGGRLSRDGWPSCFFADMYGGQKPYDNKSFQSENKADRTVAGQGRGEAQRRNFPGGGI